MFKPGEIARIKDSERIVTIESIQPASGGKWPISTNEGVFDESALTPAHPSVLATAQGRNTINEAFNARTWSQSDSDFPKGMSIELMLTVQSILQKAIVAYNGHWKNGETIRDTLNVLQHLFLGPKSLDPADAEEIVSAAKVGKAIDRWVPLRSLISGTLRTCPCCGDGDFETETNGKVVRIMGDPCVYPKGLPLTEWELNVPSGKLVVANDLRDIFPVLEEDLDISSYSGCSQTALAYAAIGLSHAFVGNSCPAVFDCGEGVYKISGGGPDEEVWNGEKWVEVDPKPVVEGKEVARICTDLWWYSICDQAEFRRRCKRFKVKPKSLDVETISVKPGVYRFRHDEEARGNDAPGECIFTRFEWVREADPVKYFLALYEHVDVNPHAYVQAKTLRWPTLYGNGTKTPWNDLTPEEQLEAWRGVADNIFCTIGGGAEWHEKGFPRDRVDVSIPDVEPPTFRRQYHWYPFTKGYGGLFEPKPLSSSFAKLAFRVLESVISFGMVVHDSEHSREVRGTRDRMLLAVQRYRELAKEHPNEAEPDYVDWLSQEGRAEAWVANFPLGPEFTDRHRERVERQRWVPYDTYAVAFDALKITEGRCGFVGLGGYWANKKDAQRYAIHEWSDNGQTDPKHNCFWTTHAKNTSIPLYSVARVVKIGDVSHMGHTLVEIAFDYGTPWMTQSSARKALLEDGEKVGIRLLTKEEYARLLPEAIEFFETAERAVKAASNK